MEKLIDFPGPDGRFEFSDTELYDGWCSHSRLCALLRSAETVITDLHMLRTRYGEWLALAVSAPLPATCWCGPSTHLLPPAPHSFVCLGLGYHPLRECWLTDRWHFRPAQSGARTLGKRAVWSRLAQRRAHCLAHAALACKPSPNALRYAALADGYDGYDCATAAEPEPDER